MEYLSVKVRCNVLSVRLSTSRPYSRFMHHRTCFTPGIRLRLSRSDKMKQSGTLSAETYRKPRTACVPLMGWTVFKAAKG
jgi:hypothetical protein